MGRFATISEKGAIETVLSYRLGALIARELRVRGWAISGSVCRGKTPVQVARLLVGPITGQQDRLAVEIAVLAGLMPALSEVEGPAEVES